MTDESNTPTLPAPRPILPEAACIDAQDARGVEILMKKRRSRVIFIGALVAFVVFAVVVRLIG